jgi:hypothetical protein
MPLFSDEPKKVKLRDWVDFLNKEYARKPDDQPTILTCPQGVVTYIVTRKTSSLSNLLFEVGNLMASGETSVDKQIKDILAANPRADLKTFETALGVTFIDIQLKDGSSGSIYG